MLYSVKHQLMPSLLAIVLSLCSCSVSKTLVENSGTGLLVTSFQPACRPVFTGDSYNVIAGMLITCEDAGTKWSIREVILSFSETSDVSDISDVSIQCGRSDTSPNQMQTINGITVSNRKISVSGNYDFVTGENKLILHVRIKNNADLAGKIKLESMQVVLNDGSVLPVPYTVFPELHFASKLRVSGQDNCDTYRIPGLVTTKKGTLIAVYDNRYLNSVDLQGDIDIGMSRSTDGGQTWEPMKVIMDMGEYGGKPNAENGVGDPCVLVDNATGTIWVAALWINGFPNQRAWNVSGPGTDPSVTGQFLVVKSEDDGITWSQPMNITSQLKDDAWRLLLQGPGNGITLSDGTIVFPAQFRAADGTPWSTIAYSSDHGTTWHIGTGAKSNTTEAQCVQLSDGSIMLNMRDNRNSTVKDATNGRAVAVTKDLGKSWTVHPSSNSALPEPVCMASLISADVLINGNIKKVLFFSNPNNNSGRSKMTIKASLDEGLTWPEKYQVLLNQDDGYGYSCLTMVDGKTVGILYEGVKDLYFQKIPVEDILAGSK